MDNFDLSSPVSVLFEKDPKTTAVEDKSLPGEGYDAMLTTASHRVGGGYRGYYWRFFSDFRRFCFSLSDSSDRIVTDTDFERSFRAAQGLLSAEYLKGVDTVEEFFDVMKCIINTTK